MAIRVCESAVELKYNLNLRDYTTIKIGGETRYFFVVHTPEELAFLVRRYRNSFYLLGAGSNLLIKDGKLSKVVVKLGEEFNYIDKRENLLEAGAAVPFSRLLKYAVENNFGGLENLAGIPASLGGLLSINASSFGRNIGSFLEEAEVMNERGDINRIKKEQVIFGYRYSSLRNYIILRAWLKLDEDKDVRQKVRGFIKLRRQSQDFDFPSCGCIFKNPPLYASGFLIDTCGLKGVKKNGAQISHKHANFIVNLGGARYNDVDYLINLVKDRVYQRYNIVLEEEICRWE